MNGSNVRCAASPARANVKYLHSSLSGSAEVNSPGSRTGTAKLDIEIDPQSGAFCYGIVFGGLGKITAMEIHKGTVGVSGNVAAKLIVPSVNGDEICTSINQALARRIAANPGNWYINIHTRAFPNGAVRGQISK